MEPNVDKTAAMINSMRAELPQPIDRNTDFMKLAKESREKNRAEREQRWNELRAKAREVRETVANAGEVGRLMVVNREVRGAVADKLGTAAKEKTIEVARGAGEKLRQTGNGLKEYVAQRAALMLAYADAEAEKAILAVGRKAVAPLVEKVMVPAAKLMESADERMIGVIVAFDKVEAKISGGASEGIKRLVGSDGMDFLWESAERSKENAKKKGSLRKLVETVGGWIGSARARSESLAANADKRRNEANQIRDWNEKRKKGQLSTGLAGVAAQLRTV